MSKTYKRAIYIYLRLTILTTMSTFPKDCCNATSTSNIFRETAKLRNLKFDQNLLFEHFVQNGFDCSRYCAREMNCLAFTFTPNTKSCRGHSTLMTTCHSFTVDPGTTYHEIEWLTKRCSSDRDCRVGNTTCYAGTCLCTVGYFYSQRNKTCLAECAEENLQDSMLRYPVVDLYGHDIEGHRNILATVQECQTICFSIAGCLVMQYVDGTDKVCYLKKATALHYPDDVNRSDYLKIHYQRTCA